MKGGSVSSLIPIESLRISSQNGMVSLVERYGAMAVLNEVVRYLLAIGYLSTTASMAALYSGVQQK